MWVPPQYAISRAGSYEKKTFIKSSLNQPIHTWLAAIGACETLKTNSILSAA